MERLFQLRQLLGHDWRSQSLLTTALTHKSHAHETSLVINDDAAAAREIAERPGDNERLEFLGDAVLDLAVSALLMQRFPLDSEGALSKKRASLVNEETLAQLARELSLESLILLGKGEMKTGGVQKPRILASALEAIFGAIYRDGGFDASLRVIEKIFDNRLTEMNNSNVYFKSDFKTRLQELSQEMQRATPVYHIVSESGPDHDKVFTVAVSIGAVNFAEGCGRNKKAAEQESARKALEELARRQSSESGTGEELDKNKESQNLMKSESAELNDGE